MPEKPIIRGLNCPQCAGALEIEAGRAVVNCPFCGVSSLLDGEKGVLRLQVRPTVGQEQVEAMVRRFFLRWDRDPDLEREAAIREFFVVYVPYWRVSMRAAAWLAGRNVGEDSDDPAEKTIVEDSVWTVSAYNASQFGLQELKGLQGRELEPFDREALRQHALVFEPETSGARASEQAELAFRQAAHRQSGVTSTLFQRFLFFGKRLSLVYYPLWVARYTFRGRSYRVVVDDHRVVYGQAPGNPTWRAAILVLAVLVGATLPLDFLMGWSWMVANEPLSLGFDLRLVESGLACGVYYATTWAVAWLSVSILLAGYRFFRFGGERILGARRKLPLQALWPTLAWGLGLVPCMILALAFPWRLEILLPTYALVSAASLGLGLLVRRRSRANGARPEVDWFQQPDWLWKAQPADSAPDDQPALKPLHCPNCQTPLPAREGEATYLCQGCGWGLELVEEGLRRIEVAFTESLLHPRIEVAQHLPFWVFEATVQVEKRKAVEKHLLGKEKASTDHGQFWQAPRQIYVPAFDAPLEDLKAWGMDLTRMQLDLSPGDSERLEGCVYTEAEARELAELIFLAIEFDKPDVMQEIDYTLTLTLPRLVVIPFVGVSK